MKDHRTLEQIFRDMQVVSEAMTPGVKRAADTLKKEMDKEKNAAKKMQMADDVMKMVLGEESVDEALEYGTDKAKNTYAKATPGQSAGDEYHPELAKKADVVIDGVPEKGGMIKKPEVKLEALDPVGKADADIDNDGDVDSSDKYLHKRRKAIKKAMKEENVDEGMMDAVKAKIGKIKKSVSDFHKTDTAAQIRKNKTTKTMEEVEIDEAKDHPAAAELKDYAVKHGGIDKQYFQSAAGHIAAGRHKELVSHIKNGDTDPRDKVLDVIHKHDKGLHDSVMKQAGYKRLREEMEEPTQVDEYITAKHIKMAKGIANDPRHKGGDYTGAAKKMEKIKKGLSNHPAVKKALRIANEDMERADRQVVITKDGEKKMKPKATINVEAMGNPTGVKIYHKDGKTGKEHWTIHFTARDAERHVKQLGKEGHKETKRALMYGTKEGPARHMN